MKYSIVSFFALIIGSNLFAQTIQFDQNQVTTLAGSGNMSFVDGIGKAAGFSSPKGIVSDGTGNLYVADQNNHCIRKITNDGVVTTLAGGTIGYADGTGASAKFRNPSDVAIDAAGNIYVADYSNHRIRKITTEGVVSTLAGNGTPGYADGIGNTASFYFPSGVALDGFGNIYVAELGNYRIRKITSGGLVSTFAGNGTSGNIDGNGLAASFTGLNDLTSDASGNLYALDQTLIRKITPTGNVSTLASGLTPSGIAIIDAFDNMLISNNNTISLVSQEGAVSIIAGSSTAGYVDSTGILARFMSPRGVAIDASGNLYVTDANRIRKISYPELSTFSSLNGRVSSVKSFSVSGMSLTSNLVVNAPTGYEISLSATEGFSSSISLPPRIGRVFPTTVYIRLSANASCGTNSGNITIVSANAITQTLAVNGSVSKSNMSVSLAASPTNGTGINITFTATTTNTGGGTISYNFKVNGVSKQNSAASNYSNSTLISGDTVTCSVNVTGGCVTNTTANSSKITMQSPSVQFDKNQVSTFAGNGTAAFADGNAASFSYPYGIVADASGNLFVADRNNNRIRKITPSGDVMTVAGSGTFGFLNGNGTAARFGGPTGIAVDMEGNLFVADYGNNRIRKITPSGDVTTVAGSGTNGYLDGNGIAARFGSPSGIAVDGVGNLYVTEFGNNRIRKITPSGDVTTLAGSGTAGYADGNGTSASFNRPIGISIDTTGNLYVADSYNHRIRKITPAGLVTTIAGSGTIGYTDGIGTSASFQYPAGISIDGAGNIFITDAGSYIVRKITANGAVSTLAGTRGSTGFADGTGITAKFAYSTGITTDASGDIYVADDANNRIRKISNTVFATFYSSKGETSAFQSFSVSGAALKGNMTISLPSGFEVSLSPGIDYQNALTLTPSLGIVAPTIIYIRLSATASCGINSGNITIASAGATSKTIAIQGFVNGAIPSVSMSASPSNSVGVNVTFTATATNIGGGAISYNFKLNGVSKQNSGSNTYSNASLIVGDIVTCTITVTGGVCLDNNSADSPALQTNQALVQFDKSQSMVFAGSSQGFVDGTGIAANFNYPQGIASDAFGNLYVADQNNHAIRKITPTGDVTTLAGNGSAGYFEGTGTSAQFNSPTSVAVDDLGNVFVTDGGNHCIRKITPEGVVTTLAGSTQTGYADGEGSAARFNNPNGIAIDVYNNLYINDRLNYRIRKITSSGIVITLAGCGIRGFADGIGTQAMFDGYGEIGTDALGNVYVADISNHRVRKINPDGIVTTLAGNGTRGYADGNNTTAQFNSPQGITIDASNNIYLLDQSSTYIRKINNKGNVTTFFGGGVGSMSGLEIDRTGNMYTSGNQNNIFKFVLPTLLDFTTTYGTPSDPKTFSVSGSGLGGNITLNAPSGFAISLNGSSGFRNSLNLTPVNGEVAPTKIYVRLSGTECGVNTGNISLTSTGAVSQTLPVEGSITSGTPKVSITADKTTIPGIVIFNANSSNIGGGTTSYNFKVNGISKQNGYLTSYSNATLVDGDTVTCSINVTGGTCLATTTANSNKVIIRPPSIQFDKNYVSSFAGSGTSSYSDGTGVLASFKNPYGITTDVLGNIYVADQLDHSIRKITPDGIVSTIAGSGTNGYANGTGIAAQFNAPRGIASDVSGNLYVADYGNSRIRKVTPTGVVSNIALGTTFYPNGLVTDAIGNIYVADYDRIRKITPAGIVTTLAGGTTGYADGTGSSAMFHNPFGIAIDNVGNLYVTDRYNYRIRKITPTGVVTTIAGNSSSGYIDGHISVAKFDSPSRITIDASLNLYVTDGNRIRKITSDGFVTTLAGSSAISGVTSGNTDGTGSLAKFNSPQGIACDVSGNIYVADSYNFRIRKIALPVFKTFNSSSGTASLPQVLSVSGSDLLDNMTLFVPAGYEASLYADSGYANSISLIPYNEIVSPTNIYIRLSATASCGNYTGYITISSSGTISKNFQINGTVTGSSTVADPTTESSGVKIQKINLNGLTLSAIKGNGSKRLFVLKNGSAVSSTAITDNQAYIANTTFGLGSPIDGGYVVYNDTGNTVNVTGFVPDGMYYASVFEYNQSGCGINYKTGSPTTTNLNIIGTNRTVTSGTYGKTIVLANGTLGGNASFTDSVIVNSGGTLDLNAKTLSGSGIIYIKDGGNLLETGTTGASTLGSKTVQLQRIGSGFNYNYWSSPIVSGKVTGSAIYRYDEVNRTAYSWLTGWKSDLGNPLTTARGYACSGSGVQYFNGIPNNGTQTIPVTKTNILTNDLGNGWNLIGNPYPSGIDITSLTTDNPIFAGSALYFWDGNNYITLKTGTVPTCQGFFVKVANANSVSFKNTQRTTGIGNLYRLSEEGLLSVLSLNNSETSDYDITQVELKAEGDDGYQFLEDAFKLKGNTTLQLYSKIKNNTDIYAISIFKDNYEPKIVPLFFDASQGGNYSITLKEFKGDPSSYTLQLADSVTGQIHNLYDGSYSFTTQATNADARFKLLINASNTVTGTNNNSISDIQQLSVYEKQVYVKSSGQFELELYSLQGTKLAKYNGNDEAVFGLGQFAAGLYLAKLSGQNGTKTVKVIVE